MIFRIKKDFENLLNFDDKSSIFINIKREDAITLRKVIKQLVYLDYVIELIN